MIVYYEKFADCSKDNKIRICVQKLITKPLQIVWFIEINWKASLSLPQIIAHFKIQSNNTDN